MRTDRLNTSLIFRPHPVGGVMAVSLVGGVICLGVIPDNERDLNLLNSTRVPRQLRDFLEGLRVSKHEEV